jgi:glycosyltransferase involved in cell wall biosynthesis
VPENRLKVSVCVVAYNHGRYIGDCLASVVGQKVDADLEILVGDDCSTDQTRQIIGGYAEKYPGLVQPVFHPRNIGGTRNYQVLIGKAGGDYIAHLDGDDYWLPEKLAEQIAFLEANRNCVAVYTNAIVISDSGESVGRFNGVLPQLFDLNYLVRKGNFLNGSSLVYRARCRNLILQLQGDALDFHFHILLAGQGALGYVNRVLAAYRRRSATSTMSTNYGFVLELYWKAILCARSMGAERGALLECVKGLVQNVVRLTAARGKLREAWHWGNRIVKECPLVSRRMLVQFVLMLPFTVGRRVLRRLARRVFQGGPEILYDR